MGRRKEKIRSMDKKEVASGDSRQMGWEWHREQERHRQAPTWSAGCQHHSQSRHEFRLQGAAFEEEILSCR